MRFSLPAAMLLMLTSQGCDPPPADRSLPDGRAPSMRIASVAASATASPVVSAPKREWPKDAPSPTEVCKAHEDCAIITWDGPWPPDPCCDRRLGFTAVNRKYLTWMYEYRKKHCQGAVCSGASLPGAEPGCCAVIPRCVAGSCKNACEDPSIVVPKVSHLDPKCRRSVLPIEDPAGM